MKGHIIGGPSHTKFLLDHYRGVNIGAPNIPNSVTFADSGPAGAKECTNKGAVLHRRAHCRFIITRQMKGKKRKEAYLYSAFYILCISQSAQAWITQFYLQIHHACLSFICVHQTAPPHLFSSHLSVKRRMVLKPQNFEVWSG